MSIEAEFFTSTKVASLDPMQRRRAWLSSMGLHLIVLAVFLVASIADWFSAELGETLRVASGPIVFYELGVGPGGGGGGGGDDGQVPTANNEPIMAEIEARRAPMAPRKPRPLNYDDLNVPDLPDNPPVLLEGAFSPQAVEFPGILPVDSQDFGGLDTRPSSGTRGGSGGGTGTGVGEGEGWGVGLGTGGGVGGGPYAPGGWDTDPIPIYEPPSPSYPAAAREKMVAGEVILQVLVKRDGSTEVVGVVKSLPFCVDAAKEHARLYRWKPALKNGRPVDALGIIIVSFDIYGQPTKS